MTTLMNVALLQATWFACVLGAASGLPWLGVAVALIMILVHLAHVPRRAPELVLVAMSGMIGIVGEGLLMASGLVRFASNEPLPAFPPAWLIALWMAFATALNVSLKPLKGRPLLATAVGGFLAPVAYYGGSRLGGITLADPVWAPLAAVGLVWAIALPLLLALAQRWDGTRTTAASLPERR